MLRVSLSNQRITSSASNFIEIKNGENIICIFTVLSEKNGNEKDIFKTKNYFESIFLLTGLMLVQFGEREGESFRSLSSFSLICRMLRELVAMPVALSRKLFITDDSLCAYNEPLITEKVRVRTKKPPATLINFII